jgi:Ca2+-binding EF-hand superfamily protein
VNTYAVQLFDEAIEEPQVLDRHRAVLNTEGISLPNILRHGNSSNSLGSRMSGINLMQSDEFLDSDEEGEARPLFLKQSIIDTDFIDRARDIQELIEEANRIPRAPSRYKATSSSTFESSKLPPISSPKSEKYFGDSSRINFYQTYRELNQQRHRFRGHEEVSADIIENQRDLDKEIDDLSLDCPWSRVGYHEDIENQPAVSDMYSDEDEDDEDGATTDCNTNRTADEEDTAVSLVSMLSTESLETAFTEGGPRSVKSYNANSPRARYLAGCLQQDIAPRCGMLLRGKETTSLWLDHLGMGDKLGVLLATGLHDMPLITSVNLTDNNLTDVSLKPLIDAIAGNPSITELFLSQNKIDSDASESLASYLSSKDCTLTKLVMRKADIDDGECHNFVEVLKHNKTLTYIDMSDNLLGKDENLNAVNPDIITGGESLAMLLTDGDCALTHLIISWNMVRMEGAVDLSNSLRGLKNLIHLDISFNSFASDAGGVLGNALLDNDVLEELIVSSNNLEGTAIFAICVGARENKSLTYLNIDGNPIGEAGARILMTLPVTRGNSLKFSARDCDVKIKHTKCAYNSNAPAGVYRLDLSDPYEQAVFLDLLDNIAKNSSYHFSNECKYFEKGDDAKSYEPLVFSHFAEPLSMETITDRSKKELLNLNVNMVISNDVEACRKTFLDFDTENKGELQSDQFFALIDSLGFLMSNNMKAMLMNVYDNDHSGAIEYEEYMDFISKMNMDALYRIRDIESIARSCLSTSGAPKRYIPPRSGVVHVEVLKSYIATDDSRALTAEQCENLLKGAKNTSHPGKVIHYASEGDKLRFAESLDLFKEIEKENSNATATLGILLPQCVNSSDAKNLAFSSGGDQEKIRMRVETALGAAYRPIMGLADGYYALDLKKEKDRSCLQKLFEIGSAITKHRKKLLLGDLSQDGNWSCFRNEYMAGRDVSITPEFMTPMPETGKIEFDFMGSQLPLKSTITLTDRKFVTLLWETHLANHKNEKWVYAQLNEMKDASLKSLSNPGLSSYFQPDIGRMVEVQRYLYDKLYSKLNERALHYEHALKREVASLLVAQPLTKLQRESTANLKSSKVVVKDGHATLVNLIQEAEDDEDEDDAISGDEDVVVDEELIQRVASSSSSTLKTQKSAAAFLSATKHQSGSGSTHKLLDELYENHPKHAAQALSQVERLVSCFSSKYLFCRHLAVLTMLFLRGTCKKTDWGTYRVELIISLFSRLKDVHNFELVLAQLTVEEHAMVLARVGILNIFNPLRPEGGYCLDLGLWEERQVAKILVHFACVEPGANWFYQEYTFDRKQVGIPGWELPVTWLGEEGMPTKGLLSLVYYSGGGLRLQGCNPTIMLREAALSLTLTHPSFVLYEKRCNTPAIKHPHICKILEINALLSPAGIMWNYYNTLT